MRSALSSALFLSETNARDRGRIREAQGCLLIFYPTGMRVMTFGVQPCAVATNISAEYAKRNHSTGRIRKAQCGLLFFDQAEYAKHNVVCSFLSDSNARDDLRRTAVSLGPNAPSPKVFSS